MKFSYILIIGHSELDQTMDSECFETTMSHLHMQFSGICDQLQLEIQKNITVNELMEAVPTTVMNDCRAINDENFSKLLEEERIKTLFEHMKNRSSILDYSLIKQVTMKFGSVQLKETMTDYVTSALDFFGSSTVQQLACVRPPQTELPKDYSDMRVQIAMDPSAYKLDKLNSFRDKYCHELNMVDVLIFTGVLLEAKSFCALWSLPTDHASNLIVSVKRIDAVFLRQESVVSIMVDQQVFYQRDNKV